MLFHSIEFFFLFIIVTPFAIFGGSHTRRLTMLAASYVFYMWFSIPLVGLLIFSSVLDFSIGRLIYNTQNPVKRKRYLIISLFCNLGMLFFFKYFNWFFGSLNSLAIIINGKSPFPFYEIILPLGISFYTFQTLSYTIDIYYKKINPTNSLLTFSLYVAFFPQLVAGPIVRASKLIPQLEEGPGFLPDQVRYGIACFIFGLIKKIVIADNLALFVNQVYHIDEPNGTVAIILATYAFAFQIYCDFSGYTDMARGIGYILGYELGINFNFPYFAKSITDFWRRWHISLSTWLRDYVYILLGGNRCSANRRNINVMATMLLGGLWHGANWTFVVWGGIHGVLIALEHRWGQIKETKLKKLFDSKVGNIVGIIITFHFVCISWIFFRASDLNHALSMCKTLLSWEKSLKVSYTVIYYIIPVIIVDYLIYKTEICRDILDNRILYWLTVCIGISLVLIGGNFKGDDFVYFQF